MTREVGESLSTHLMRAAFVEGYRVLKPGRWITVEFHNSSNAVWHAIQEALFAAGFVVADVRTLSKMQETYKQSRQGLMKQDLVISAYKPTSRAEELSRLSYAGEGSVWSFTREHLERLPIATLRDGAVEPVAERQSRVLYDRMVAFFVQRGIAVPVSSTEYYAGLQAQLPARDGVYFLESQLAEYERILARAGSVRQIELFVNDEATAIEWLRVALAKKPQTIQDLNPNFMRETNSWVKHEEPIELETLLRENFLCYDGSGPVPSRQVHSYLSTTYREYRNLAKTDEFLIGEARDRWYVPDPNKQSDLEKLRVRGLLREFEEYKDTKQHRRKLFRTEAVRAGFKAAYDAGDYQTIVSVAATIPDTVLQEDEKLLMYFDVASMRLGKE